MNLIISESPSKSWIFKVLLPSGIGLIILITAFIIGFVYYQRHRRRQQESTIRLEILK